MTLPDTLVANHHTVAAGGIPLLSTDGHDFFPAGAEPSLRHSQSVDAPDCPGLQDGPFYLRGNVRWTATVTRVREFLTFSYPIMDASVSSDPVPTPEAYAQLWLVHHLRRLAAITGAGAGLEWNGSVWPTASIQPEGVTDAGFVLLNYQIQMGG